MYKLLIIVHQLILIHH